MDCKKWPCANQLSHHSFLTQKAPVSDMDAGGNRSFGSNFNQLLAGRVWNTKSDPVALSLVCGKQCMFSLCPLKVFTTMMMIMMMMVSNDDWSLEGRTNNQCAVHFLARTQFAVHLLVWFFLHNHFFNSWRSCHWHRYIHRLTATLGQSVDCLNCAVAEHLNSQVVTS